jgi:hypothetical protein
LVDEGRGSPVQTLWRDDRQGAEYRENTRYPRRVGSKKLDSNPEKLAEWLEWEPKNRKACHGDRLFESTGLRLAVGT